MKSTEIVVSLDIGTTKICAIAARRNDDGLLEVLGIGKANSQGLMRGVIHNIAAASKAIQEAIETCENQVGSKIKRVFVGIAGQHIKSVQHRGYCMRDNDTDEISQTDIDKLISDMHKLVFPHGDKIIHVLPQEFIVDNEEGIKDPIGMSGVRLESDFHIITGQVTAIQNIYRCVEKAGLEVADLVLEPIASCSSVLNEEEKEAGVALVDIGGGTTDIAIFQDGIIRHTAVIPLGGNIVTEDIKEGCGILRSQAEDLKLKYGSALALESQEREVVAIPGLRGREPKEISVKNLAHIIQSRMEEIMEHVYYEVRRSGYENKLICGIVACGGGSQLRNLRPLTEYITGLPARIGMPTELLVKKNIESISTPMYATSIGLAIKGLEEVERKEMAASIGEEVSKKQKHTLGKILNDWNEKIKEFFMSDVNDFNES